MHVKQFRAPKRLWFYPPDPIPPGELYLIGTIHRLPRLAPFLEDCLNMIRPEIITVEISPYSLRKRQREEDLWLKRFEELRRRLSPQEREHPALLLYREALKIPYEIKVAQKWGQDRGIPVIPIDSSRVAKNWLKRLLSGLSWENFKALTRQERERYHLKHTLNLVAFYLRTGVLPSRDEEDLLRERLMLRRLRRIFQKKRPVVHIGGWGHLFSLAEALEKAIPIFIKGQTDLSFSFKSESFTEN